MFRLSCSSRRSPPYPGHARQSLPQQIQLGLVRVLQHGHADAGGQEFVLQLTCDVDVVELNTESTRWAQTVAFPYGQHGVVHTELLKIKTAKSEINTFCNIHVG
jgi:hypothetical protein